VAGFGKEGVRRGSPRGCAFDWLKIAGQSKKLPISTFCIGEGEGEVVGGGFFWDFEGIWVGFFIY
jgi:hypothetical protein